MNLKYYSHFPEISSSFLCIFDKSIFWVEIHWNFNRNAIALLNLSNHLLAGDTIYSKKDVDNIEDETDEKIRILPFTYPHSCSTKATEISN